MHMLSNNNRLGVHFLQNVLAFWNGFEEICITFEGSSFVITKCTLIFRIYFLDWDDVPPSSALEEISEEEAVKIIADPLLPPQSSALRDYVDHSETLTKLVHLGVCDFVYVFSVLPEPWRFCSLCFDLIGGFVNLKISDCRNGDR